MLPNISQADLDYPSAAGEYPYEDGFVQVQEFHIVAWTNDPDMSFGTILRTRLGDSVLRLALRQT